MRPSLFHDERFGSQKLSDQAKRVLSVIVWLICVAIFAVMMRYQHVNVPIWGIVGGDTLPVRAPLEGRFVDLSVQVGDQIIEGTPIARIHSPDLQARILALDQKLTQHKSHSEVILRDLKSRILASAEVRQMTDNRYTYEIVELNKLLWDAKAELARRQIEWMANKAEMNEAQRQLTDGLGFLERGLITGAELNELRLRISRLAAKVKQASAAREMVFQKISNLEQHLNELPSRGTSEIDLLQPALALERSRNSLKAQEIISKRAELLAIANESVIRAPVSGTVAEIILPSGGWCMRGDTLIRLRSGGADTVTALVPATEMPGLTIGTSVRVSSVDGRLESLPATVHHIGAMLTSGDVMLAANFRQVPHGIPVTLELLAEGLIHGEAVRVTLP